LGFEELIERIKFIPNSVYIPENIDDKNYLDPLKVLVIGRGTYEKRIHLILKAAKILNKTNPSISFTFVGPEEAKFSCVPLNCTIIEATTNKEIINKYYKKNHLITIVSEREGFPLVLAEGMAFGLVPVTTAVGGIPFVIESYSNGILILESEERQIVDKLIEVIIELEKRRDLLLTMSIKARQYAVENFNYTNFRKEYISLFK
jgi:glycosyltransferase involved in cell wall biosynthesis